LDKKEEDEEGQGEEHDDSKNKVLPTMNTIFTEIQHEIHTKAKDKLTELKKMHMLEENYDDEDWDEKKNANHSPLDDLVGDIT